MMPRSRCSRLLLAGLGSTLLANTACIDRTLAATSSLAPQPSQSVLFLETSEVTPVAGSTVTIRGRLLRGAQVAPAGAFTVRLTYDTTLLALAPTVSAGIDASAFGTRAAAAAAVAPPAFAASSAVATADSPARALLTSSRKTFPKRAAARVGDDSLALSVVRVHAARQAALAAATARTDGIARVVASNNETVMVPEGLRAVRVVRAGELRVASVVPDGLQGEVLFEVPFVVKRAGTLGALTLDLEELVSVSFADQRVVTRVEQTPVRRVAP